MKLVQCHPTTVQATLFGQYRRIMEEDGEAKDDEKEEGDPNFK